MGLVFLVGFQILPARTAGYIVTVEHGDVRESIDHPCIMAGQTGCAKVVRLHSALSRIRDVASPVYCGEEIIVVWTFNQSALCVLRHFFLNFAQNRLSLAEARVGSPRSYRSDSQ